MFTLARSNCVPRLAFVFTCVALLTGCPSSDDDDDDDGGTVALPPGRSYVSNNGTANQGNVDRFNENFQLQSTFIAGNNEGVELDVAGNLYQAGDVVPAGEGTTPGSIRFISAIGAQPNGTGFDLSFDRELGGPASTMTGLANPKGIEAAHCDGFLFVANNATSEILVFGTAAGGDVAPFATTPVGAPPWDLAYDEILDRLFVSTTNGDVRIFDDYVLNSFGMGGPDRVVVPSDGTIQISTNLHGIAYNFGTDALFATDVGAANAGQSPDFASDGSIYVFFGASIIDGLVVPDRNIAGPSTLLGNPVDCAFTAGTDLLVAEKANDFLLRFNSIFSGASGDVPPDLTRTEIKPESIAVEAVDQFSNPFTNPDVSDIDNPGQLLIGIGTTNNPADLMDPDSGMFARLTVDLSLERLSADLDVGLGGLVFSLENVTFDEPGDAYVTFDDGTNMNGGVLVANRLARTRGAITESRDRVITGANTTLVSPKGIDIDGGMGWMMVAENNATTPAIVGFGTQAHGDVAPAFSTDLAAIGRPWDLDYDPTNDRLFVALTNGTVAVFDSYSQNLGAGGPQRMITPSDGVNPISVNLHGIVHTVLDQLILSDVGDAGDATDGQLFVIENASTANGDTMVTVQIGGPSTLLGNPVDLAFNGANVYVAEKSNDMVLRFDNILTAASGDTAPSQMTARTKPESVVVLPSFLSGTPPE